MVVLWYESFLLPCLCSKPTFLQVLFAVDSLPQNWLYVPFSYTHTHTHTRLTALCPGLPRWAGTRKVKPVWILLEQETVSGSGISWAICKSTHRSRQITTPAPHHSVFLQAGCPFCRPTNSAKALKVEINVQAVGFCEFKISLNRVGKRLWCSGALTDSWSFLHCLMVKAI